MRNFDPTPAGVTYYRINAIGFAVSILAMFVAMYWWMAETTPALYGEPIVFGIFAVTALITAGMYVVPVLAPRKNWGYILGWIQIAFSVSSMTATLPSLAVIIAYARDEVREWFDGKPVGFRSPRTAHAAVVTALVGYYAVISAVPFGFAWAFHPDRYGELLVQEAHAHGSVSVEEVVTPESEAGEPVDFRAVRLTSGSEWELAEQDRPVAVTVWATYCGACSTQLRSVANAPGGIGDSTKHVTLALDCEKQGRDHRAHVRSKLGDSGITSEALCATESGGVEVDKLPTTVFFDAEGRMRATLEGYHTAHDLDQVAVAVER